MDKNYTCMGRTANEYTKIGSINRTIVIQCIILEVVIYLVVWGMVRFTTEMAFSILSANDWCDDSIAGKNHMGALA